MYDSGNWGLCKGWYKLCVALKVKNMNFGVVLIEVSFLWVVWTIKLQ